MSEAKDLPRPDIALENNLFTIFYESTTKAALELQAFGEKTFQLGRPSTLGLLGISVQDTRTFLVGLQNILAIHLGRPALQLNLSTPVTIDTPNDFLTAMQAVHRYFFISVQSALEGAAQRVCVSRLARNLTGERAFRRALTILQSDERIEWRRFYEGVKVIRNQSAHSSTGTVEASDLIKLREARLDFLVSSGRVGINCSMYLPIFERACACITALLRSSASQDAPNVNAL